MPNAEIIFNETCPLFMKLLATRAFVKEIFAVLMKFKFALGNIQLSPALKEFPPGDFLWLMPKD